MKVSVSPSVILMGFIIFISGNIKQAIIPLIAALIHELGHIFFAFLFNVRIERIKLNLFGAIINISPLACSYKREAMLAAAGPMCNIISAVIAFPLIYNADGAPQKYIILFVVSSFLFAFINLLPAENFDGGRILNCFLLSIFSPAIADRVMGWISLFCIFFLWGISVYFILRTGSYISLFVFSGTLFSKIYLIHTKKRD